MGSTPDLTFNSSAGDVAESTDLKLFTSAGYGGSPNAQWVQAFSGSLVPAQRYLVMQVTGGTSTNGPQEAVFVGR